MSEARLELVREAGEIGRRANVHLQVEELPYADQLAVTSELLRVVRALEASLEAQREARGVIARQQRKIASLEREQERLWKLINAAEA